MLADYRRWLESELNTLGNASHHAYAFGQANMAKRALERFDKEAQGLLLSGVDAATARDAVASIDALLAEHPGAPHRALATVRAALAAALAQGTD